MKVFKKMLLSLVLIVFIVGYSSTLTSYSFYLEIRGLIAIFSALTLGYIVGENEGKDKVKKN